MQVELTQEEINVICSALEFAKAQWEGNLDEIEELGGDGRHLARQILGAETLLKKFEMG